MPIGKWKLMVVLYTTDYILYSLPGTVALVVTVIEVVVLGNLPYCVEMK
jgi:hypothetical protein